MVCGVTRSRRAASATVSSSSSCFAMSTKRNYSIKEATSSKRTNRLGFPGPAATQQPSSSPLPEPAARLLVSRFSSLGRPAEGRRNNLPNNRDKEPADNDGQEVGVIILRQRP